MADKIKNNSFNHVLNFDDIMARKINVYLENFYVCTEQKARMIQVLPIFTMNEK